MTIIITIVPNPAKSSGARTTNFFNAPVFFLLFFANKSIIPVTINATIRILKKSILFPPTILGIIQLLVPRL